jgi:hypothetical protein
MGFSGAPACPDLLDRPSPPKTLLILSSDELETLEYVSKRIGNEEREVARTVDRWPGPAANGASACRSTRRRCSSRKESPVGDTRCIAVVQGSDEMLPLPKGFAVRAPDLLAKLPIGLLAMGKTSLLGLADMRVSR